MVILEIKIKGRNNFYSKQYRNCQNMSVENVNTLTAENLLDFISLIWIFSCVVGIRNKS